GTFEIEMFIGGAQRILNGGTITLNQWTQIAATYDGRLLKIFQNSIEVGSLSVTGAIGLNTNDVFIGSRGGALFTGKMDEVRIWNLARSQAEIQSDMNCEILTPQNGLVANYHFNQGTAGGNNSGITSLTDASGNVHHGTLNNFSLNGTTS